MQQMDVPGDEKIELDFEDSWYSAAVRALRPVVRKIPSGYSCMLGPDIDRAITGSGGSLVLALEEWEKNLRKRIMYHQPDDEVALYVIDQLNASNKKIN